MSCFTIRLSFFSCAPQIAPSRRARPCPEALACVGQLARAVGPDYTEHARSLLEPLFQGGLSPILVESLAQIASRYGRSRASGGSLNLTRRLLAESDGCVFNLIRS